MALQISCAKKKVYSTLRSAYTLVRIQIQGDERRTVSSAISEFDEYLVMPYGLVNAPSVFQMLMMASETRLVDSSVHWWHFDVLQITSTTHKPHQEKSSRKQPVGSWRYQSLSVTEWPLSPKISRKSQDLCRHFIDFQKYRQQTSTIPYHWGHTIKAAVDVSYL